MTPAELYKRINRRLDLEPSAYLSADELGQVCEEGYLELWDTIIAAAKDEAPWNRFTVSTVAGQDFIDLTLQNQVYKLLRIEFKGSSGNLWLPVKRFNLTADARDDRQYAWTSADSFRYLPMRASRATEAARSTLVQTYSTWKLYLSPVPSAIYTLTVYAVPPPPISFTWAADVPAYTFFPDEFPEYVVEYAAAKMAEKQEQDPAPFLAGKEAQRAMVERTYTPLVINTPQFLPDLRSYQAGDEAGGRDGFWDRRG